MFFHLSVQILLNYAVTLGLFPTMGVTLPFISAGGSAAFFTLLELGLVLAVSRQNEEDALYLEANSEVKEENPYLKQLAEEGFRLEPPEKKRAAARVRNNKESES